MQLWFPSALAEPLSPGLVQSLAEDPELEFDREVYPIGISLSDVSVIGEAFLINHVATRDKAHFSTHDELGRCQAAVI